CVSPGTQKGRRSVHLSVAAFRVQISDPTKSPFSRVGCEVFQSPPAKTSPLSPAWKKARPCLPPLPPMKAWPCGGMGRSHHVRTGRGCPGGHATVPGDGAGGGLGGVPPPGGGELGAGTVILSGPCDAGAPVASTSVVPPRSSSITL